MKLAFTAQFDVRNIQKRSGTPFYMTKHMEEEGIALEYLCPLKTVLPKTFKFKRFWKKLNGQHESSKWQISVAQQYAKQVQEKLTQVKVDGVIAHILSPMAYLDCKEPLFLWTDVLYASHLGFYPGFAQHSAETIRQANIITREFLNRAKLAIFSSEWAARGATEIYGVSKSKVRVVPYGANIDYRPNFNEVKEIIRKRSSHTIKLLFLGKPWEAKGGDIVLNVANALRKQGHNIELNIVGCHPPLGLLLPAYVKCHGFISKKTEEGMKKILQLLSDSHFLFVPTRAEAFGIVFCEANAFGLPCLTSHVGGLPVRDHINGMTFGLDASIDSYCEFIVSLFANYSAYEALALSSFNEYETRLNWTSATRAVKQMINDIL